MRLVLCYRLEELLAVGHAKAGYVVEAGSAVQRVRMDRSVRTLHHEIDFGKQAADGNFYGGCSVAGVSGPPHVCRVTTSGAVTPIFQFPSGRWPANGILTQGSDGFLYGAAWKNNYTSELIFQLSTSGSYREIYNSPNNCTPKTGCSTVIQASDGNLWITNPPGDSVYSITTGGQLLQTVSFSSQPNAYAHPQVLIQASNGILYGTTGEPNPAYYALGSVFSLDAGLPPPR
jgi:hypothetical protein